MESILILIPAYNEELRIGNTLEAYQSYFKNQEELLVDFMVVLNGCVDNTLGIVTEYMSKMPNLSFLDLTLAGKGHAVTQGLKTGLTYNYQLFGLADADMSTSPEVYHRLIKSIQGKADLDGVIASRYISGAKVSPPRPLIKRWGSKYIYEPLVARFLNLHFQDLQCGEKIFKRHVIEKIVPYLQEAQWAFDIELLYLCKKAQFFIKEIPTEWEDQKGSKLKIMSSGLRMLRSLFTIRAHHKNNKL